VKGAGHSLHAGARETGVGHASTLYAIAGAVALHADEHFCRTDYRTYNKRTVTVARSHRYQCSRSNSRCRGLIRWYFTTYYCAHHARLAERSKRKCVAACYTTNPEHPFSGSCIGEVRWGLCEQHRALLTTRRCFYRSAKCQGVIEPYGRGVSLCGYHAGHTALGQQLFAERDDHYRLRPFANVSGIPVEEAMRRQHRLVQCPVIVDGRKRCGEYARWGRPSAQPT
jgi:hypothetical protein